MKKYSENRESGVEWIDHIPSHWLIIPFRRVIEFLTDFEANGSFSSLSDNVVDDFENKHAWFVRATDLENKNYETFQECRFINEASYLYLSKTKLFGNELLIAKRGEIGKVYLMPKLDIRASLAPNLYLLRLVNEKMSPLFAYYYFLSDVGRSQLVNSNKSTTIGALYKDDCKKLEILYPPIFEQSHIATFLDHKTRQIDDLIAKKQRLIELLQEERTALINQAVTKGLDPTVPMKDSGIEWLGVIPEHWEIRRLKDLLIEGKEGIKIGPFGSALKLDKLVDSGYKVYGQENVINNDFSVGRRYISEEYYQEMSNYTIIEGDLIITMMGTTGKCKVVPKNIDEGIMDSHLIRIRINKKRYNAPLLALLINDSHSIAYNIKIFSKGSIMEGLNSSIVKSLIIPVPPLTEQVSIFNFIIKKTNRITTTIEKAVCEISLLNEYKTSLINEAVTGKIDVRDYNTI